MIDNCPQCALQHSLDLTREQKEAERVALGMCWLDGGIVNDDGKPTIIRIDCPISNTHRAEMMALLKKIENTKEQKDG